MSDFSKFRADYDMSRESRYDRRRTGLAPQGNTADWHYRVEEQYYRDMEKARDMARNDSIIGQTTDRAVTNVVQGGFTLNPNTGSKPLDRELKARWDEWSQDPDMCSISGEHCWHDFEIMSLRSCIVDGDFTALAIESGHLQPIEAHQIRTSQRQENTFLGVTKNAYGRHEQVWIRKDAITPSEGREQSSPVNVRNNSGLRTVFQVYDPKRFSQTRGVTAYAPIFSIAGMLDDLQFAALVKQQVTSCFTVFRERDGDLTAPHAIPNYGEQRTESTVYGGTRQLDGIAPGMEILGEPGEKLSGFSPGVPGEQFFPHVNMLLNIIGVNLGLPLCLVMMDGSQTNFSGWRGAVDEARKGWSLQQDMLIKRLHMPVYRWKVAQWMAEDVILRDAAKRDSVNINRHSWTAPAWPYINPKEDAEADALQISSGLTSPRRKHAERGKDWDVISTEIVEDNLNAIDKAKKAADRINKKYGDDQPVHWRELINMPLPDGVQMQMMDSVPGEETQVEGESINAPEEESDS